MTAALSLVLASGSPRRKALLVQAGIAHFRVVTPAVDEAPHPRELPRPYALRIALAKAAAVQEAAGEDDLVLAADTAVTVGRRILPKPESAEEVSACLALLSGRRHRVYTALVLWPPGARPRTRIVETRVRFKRLSAAEIAAYADSREGEGKAGGYAIQGRADTFVVAINGSYSNVVGLPLRETMGLLTDAGYRPD